MSTEARETIQAVDHPQWAFRQTAARFFISKSLSDEIREAIPPDASAAEMMHYLARYDPRLYPQAKTAATASPRPDASNDPIKAAAGTQTSGNSPHTRVRPHSASATVKRTPSQQNRAPTPYPNPSPHLHEVSDSTSLTKPDPTCSPAPPPRLPRSVVPQPPKSTPTAAGTTNKARLETFTKLSNLTLSRGFTRRDADMHLFQFKTLVITLSDLGVVIEDWLKIFLFAQTLPGAKFAALHNTGVWRVAGGLDWATYERRYRKAAKWTAAPVGFDDGVAVGREMGRVEEVKDQQREERRERKERNERRRAEKASREGRTSCETGDLRRGRSRADSGVKASVSPRNEGKDGPGNKDKNKNKPENKDRPPKSMRRDGSTTRKEQSPGPTATGEILGSPIMLR